MKKRLLFVMESMGSGGGERSLLSLLQLLDFDKYSVDLLLFNKSGLFLDMLPEKVNVIDFGESYGMFSLNLIQSLKALLAGGKVGLAVQRLLYTKALRSKKFSSLQRDQRSWKYMKKAFADKSFSYDAAIGYLEGKPNFFVADCVEARVKIGYIHSDYRKLGMDKSFDEKVFEKLDYVVGVSDKCAAILREEFPALKEKIRAIENITSPAVLRKMAEKNAEEYKNINSKILLTVGRISPPKGYDIAVDAAELLAKSGVEFKWFAIGKGELQAEIEQKIKEKGLEDRFILLGERSNPYPYISGCDIYVQPSYYEGKSIAIDEAKAFAKPIVATKFTTVHDQLEHGVTALLAEIDAASVAEKINLLIADEERCRCLSENLAALKHGNEKEIEKLYEMLGDR